MTLPKVACPGGAVAAEVIVKESAWVCDGCGDVMTIPYSYNEVAAMDMTEMIAVLPSCSHCYNLADYEPEDIPRGSKIHWGWMANGSPAHKDFMKGKLPMDTFMEGIANRIKTRMQN